MGLPDFMQWQCAGCGKTAKETPSLAIAPLALAIGAGQTEQQNTPCSMLTTQKNGMSGIGACLKTLRPSYRCMTSSVWASCSKKFLMFTDEGLNDV